MMKLVRNSTSVLKIVNFVFQTVINVNMITVLIFPFSKFYIAIKFFQFLHRIDISKFLFLLFSITQFTDLILQNLFNVVLKCLL